MDDSSAKMRANMERVLRAMDVIPPLGSRGRSASRAGSRSRSESDELQSADDPISSESPGDPTVIPQFDLGEKILAEQRRLTANRRKAPRAVETAPSVPDERAQRVSTISPNTGPSQEQLLQLQQIVADIVARDIEGLCTGPAAVTPLKKGYGAIRSPFQK